MGAGSEGRRGAAWASARAEEVDGKWAGRGDGLEVMVWAQGGEEDIACPDAGGAVNQDGDSRRGHLASLSPCPLVPVHRPARGPCGGAHGRCHHHPDGPWELGFDHGGSEARLGNPETLRWVTVDVLCGFCSQFWVGGEREEANDEVRDI